jgi:superfamily II DNA/RNA helicase
LAGSYLQDPITIEVARPNETAATITQQFFSAGVDDKYGVLRHLIREHGVKQAFVFCNSKLGCSRLARSLERDGYRANALHGDKSQDERLKALDAFKRGEVDLLVCTDVAARGLDIKDVPAVFNFDIPFNAEDYVHRIGRTGRAGASGAAYSFVAPSDQRLVGDIEKLIKTKITLEKVEARQERRRDPREGGAREGSRDGHREGGRSRSHEGEDSHRRRPRETGYMPVPRVVHDPFFDKPYEPTGAANEAPKAKAPEPAVPRRSANIKSKRVVAALFKASTPVE